MGSLIKAYDKWDLGGLRMKSRPKVRDKISRFSRLKWTMSAENSAGNPNLSLVLLEKQSPAEIQRLCENAWWSKLFTYYNSWAGP